MAQTKTSLILRWSLDATLLTGLDLIVLFYIDRLNKTESLIYIKVHEVKKALIKDTGPVNRVHLTVLVSIENIYILGIG